MIAFAPILSGLGPAEWQKDGHKPDEFNGSASLQHNSAIGRTFAVARGI
jgi:hypothetical protein